jgi:hypothetical protein
MEESRPRESILKTWYVLFFLMALILFKGLLAFLHVGDRGQPDWDYRPVRDVPGQSPYAVYRLLPHPQHVRGAEGE